MEVPRNLEANTELKVDMWLLKGSNEYFTEERKVWIFVKEK